MATGGFGATLYVGSGLVSTTPSYTAVADVEDISTVGGKSIMDDITAHDSTGGFREKIATGLMEMDDLDVKLIHNLSNAQQAYAAGGFAYNWVNKVPLAYKITLADGMDWIFDAYVSGWKLEAVKDKAMRSTITLTITGQPTITA